jgi:hypothetical protein
MSSQRFPVQVYGEKGKTEKNFCYIGAKRSKLSTGEQMNKEDRM